MRWIELDPAVVSIVRPENPDRIPHDRHPKIGTAMTMGTGVVLFVIGAILAFAVHVQTAFISLSTAGYILMVAGVIVFVIGLALTIRGRRSVTTTTTAAPGGVAGTTRESVRTSEPTDL